jgi:hypothetical protein
MVHFDLQLICIATIYIIIIELLQYGVAAVSSDTQLELSDQTRCLLYTTTDTFMHNNLLM